jgi:DNA-binding beta-propeller fold protein YncE
MHADRVYVVDASSFKQIDFIPTGVGTHGLYPSRDGTALYVANRGSHSTRGTRTARAASPPSIYQLIKSSVTGRSPAAAAPTWAMSATTASSRGCRDGGTMSSATSIRPPGGQNPSQSAKSRTG